MSVSRLETGRRALALQLTSLRVALAAAAIALCGCGDDGRSAKPSNAATDAAAEATDGADVSGDSGRPPVDYPDVEEGWAMYGYDLANTQAYPEPTRLTDERVKDLAPRWRIRVGGGATSTPVVVDSVVYFGAWDGFFYAVDSATGALRWKRALGRQFVRSTPLVADGRVRESGERYFGH